MENKSEKKEKELEEGEINGGTEIYEISEGNDIGEVEQMREPKKKKSKTFYVRRNQFKAYFLIRLTSLVRKLEMQYGIDHKKEKKDERVKIHILRE